MTIQALIEAIPPPRQPFEAFSGPWEPVEAELNSPLPQDYKDLARLYGSGRFLDFLSVFLPRAGKPFYRLEAVVPTVCATFRNDDDLPYPMWPEAEGLLPWCVSDDGDEFFWLRRGLPEAWRVVMWDRGFQTFEAFDYDLTGFLAALATRELLPGDYPDDLLAYDRPFAPDWTSSHRVPSAPKRARTVRSSNGAVEVGWTLGGFLRRGVSRLKPRPRDRST